MKNTRQAQLTRLTEGQKEGARAWLSENYPYVIKCTSNVLNKPWYRQHKAAYFKEAISEATECIFLYHHRYIDGERSLRSWLYRMMSYFLRNFMNRKVIPYERSLVFDKAEYSMLDRLAITDDFAVGIEESEERDGVTIWGNEITEETTTHGKLNIF